VQKQLVVERHERGLADGKAIHTAVDAPAESIGGVETLVVPMIEGVVVEAGVVGWCGEMAVEEGEVGLGIGGVGYPLGAEHNALRLAHLLLEDGGLYNLYVQLYAYILQLAGYKVHYIGIVIGGLDGDGREAAAVGVACLREQCEGFLRVVVVAIVIDGFEAGHAWRYETACSRQGATVLEVGNYLMAVYGVVDSLANEDIAGGRCLHDGVGGIGEEAEVFGIEIDALAEANLVGVFFLEGAVFLQNEVFEGTIDVIDKVEFALEEEEELDGFGFVEAYLNCIEVWEGLALCVVLPVVGVAVEDEDVAFIPIF